MIAFTPSTLSILAVVLYGARQSLATPAGLGMGRANHTLDLRDFPVSCGYNNAYPCLAGEYCYTSDGTALCGASPQTSAGWEVVTTTYVESEVMTITSTYSVQVEPTTTSSAGSGTCNANLGQTQCGSICCASNQWCNGDSCIEYGGTTGAPATGSASTISNFVAPTSVGVVTITSTGTATTTVPFETPIGSSGSSLTGITAQQSSGGLSGGAIAGIVIGVLVGLFILFLVLACLCCRSIFGAIFGRNKRKETTTYIETHHSHHGSVAPPPRRRWFGALPGRADRPEKKSSGIGGLVGVGAALAAVAVILGLKRKRDRRDEKSDYTASSYTYSDYYTETSESSASSDRRTRDSRRSRSHR